MFLLLAWWQSVWIYPPFIVGILATYIGGQGPLPPKCLGGKGSHNGHFEREHKDVPTLTKVVFACKRTRR